MNLGDLKLHEYIKKFIRNSNNETYRNMVTIRRFDEGTDPIPPHALRELALKVPCQGDLKLLQALYALGVDREMVDSSGDSALHLASYMNQSEILSYLLENGLKGIINSRNNYYWTPASIAVFHSPKCLEILISHSANLDYWSSSGLYPEHRAVLGEHPERSLEILHNAGIDFSRKAKGQYQGLTAFDIARKQKIVPAIRYLKRIKN
ncbi:MAG TPA: ankyrin repeat domain-containing protein [Oligoflexia bacterium]|nr:ankyrin repeat domain-containing protein [Oligoflexia bacterium]HMP49214.1 ankyrin repeat domain-containing protein [Oligoflexia bacterium]